jgi:hypothetical protein
MRDRFASRVLGVATITALLGAARSGRAQEQPQTPSEDRRIKSYALSMGMRAGLFLPGGGLYADRDLVTTPFRDVASAGPALEFDLGVRFVRHFVGYAFFEHAFLGRGNSAAWTVPHGGQSSPSTQALGIGLRWESNPDGLGLVADVALAHRWFTARWADATTVRLQGPGEVRLGLGLSWRVSRSLALAPMVTVLTGTFTERTLDGQTFGDMTSSYTAAALSLTGQADF